MSVPDASKYSEWPNYEHLHEDDRPRMGIGGLLPEDRAAQYFTYERYKRAIIKHLLKAKQQHLAEYLLSVDISMLAIES